MQEPTTAFGTRLRELRRARNWSQTELAERIGTTQSYISKLERGPYTPTLVMVHALELTLGADGELYPLTRPSELAANLRAHKGGYCISASPARPSLLSGLARILDIARIFRTPASAALST